MSSTSKAKFDTTGEKMGMWLFLFTEVMLFTGLFVIYATYHAAYLESFIEAGKKLDLVVGSANTIILLTSSFAVAASVTAIQKGDAKLTKILLVIAIILGLAFLTNKYFEWMHKIHDGIYPWSKTMASFPPGKRVFFGLYYTVTGLHALHVIIGLVVLSIALLFVQKGKVNEHRPIFLDNAGLYWHLVDIIWIFLFPLFYLLL